MSEIADAHDIWCNCNSPFSHLLASIFPPGHQDRTLTINQIIQRDYKEQCHSGGTEGRNHGLEPATTENKDTIKEERDSLGGADVEELLAAAAADAEPR